MKSHKVRVVVLLKGFLKSNVFFSFVTDIADVHYNFRVKEEILNYPFHVNFAGETFNFQILVQIAECCQFEL